MNTSAVRRGGLCVLCGVSLFGCGRGEGDGARADSTTATSASEAPTPAGSRTPGDSTACPDDGRWRLCSVVDRLEDAGLVLVKQDEPARHPFFSVPGTAYKVARGDLEVFLYDDAAAVARDVGALDTVRVAPKGETGPWRTRPAFIRSANMIAVYMSLNEAQMERVQLALGAGPPQPGAGGGR